MHLLTGLCSLPSKFLVQQPTLYPSGHFSLLFLFFFFTVYIMFLCKFTRYSLLIVTILFTFYIYELRYLDVSSFIYCIYFFVKPVRLTWVH